MSLSPLEELHSIANKFGNPVRKKELLQNAMHSKLSSAKVVSHYHNTLLFLLAYPENEALFSLAKTALQKLSDDLSEIKTTAARRRREKPEGSGIIHTELIFSPSFDLLKRLNELFPEQIRIHSSSASKETVSKILKLLLPSVEHETIDKKDLLFLQRIHQLRKGKSSESISWLLNLFNHSRFFERSRETLIDYIFDSLEIFVSISLNEKTFSRTTTRSLSYPVYFHTSELKKHVDAKKILDEKISKPNSLKKEERVQIADVSRMTLALLARETDPVTYANENDIEWHDMGKGFRIALFGMIPSRRLPFDAYIGYVAFKNEIPAAYGGAWMFGEGAKVGVNIFEALRGGESAWIFCQVLRLYRQRFDVKKFVVEPYQYGKNNPEGIQSGAFWFYYRLGFRPVNVELNLLAEVEAKKIREQKGYRSSSETLKKFTNSNIALHLSDKEIFFPDTETLSVAITNHIATKFSGNRKAAESFAKNYLIKTLGLKIAKWSSNEKAAFQNLCFLFLLVPGIEKWNAKEKKLSAEMLKARGAETESGFIELAGKNRRLLKQLSHINS